MNKQQKITENELDKKVNITVTITTEKDLIDAGETIIENFKEVFDDYGCSIEVYKKERYDETTVAERNYSIFFTSKKFILQIGYNLERIDSKRIPEAINGAKKDSEYLISHLEFLISSLDE